MRQLEKGFTLLEVLVTVFVTAIGLLTVAGLQAMSKKVNYDATQRTTATALAQDIIERMRANPGQLDLYKTTDATAVSSANACSGASAACTPTQLAAQDLYQWGQALLGSQESVGSDKVGGLAAPTGCVSGGSGLYIVTIVWRGVLPGDPPVSGETGYTTCGNSKSDYDDPDESGSDLRMRRSLIVNAFVANPYAP